MLLLDLPFQRGTDRNQYPRRLVGGGGWAVVQNGQAKYNSSSHTKVWWVVRVCIYVTVQVEDDSAV